LLEDTMMSLPSFRPCKTDFVVRRLHDLGEHLTELTARVRHAVIEAIREMVANLARDTVDQLLIGRLSERRMPKIMHGYRDDYDPWADDRERQTWTEREPDDFEDSIPTTSSAVATVSTSPCALAVALAAAGWWLRQRGTLLGACGVALVAAVAAIATQRLTSNGLPWMQAASELLNLHRCLSTLGTATTNI
jgi:hypothetical protein